MRDLFYNFRNKFLKFNKEIYPLISKNNRSKIDKYVDRTLKSCLSFSVLNFLYHYRMLVVKTDHLKMKELNCLPFPSNPNSDLISTILEYFERTESSAFALFSL